MSEILPPERGRERQASARAQVRVPGPRPGHEARGPLPPAAPLPAGLVETLVATAGRAPSLHNTQPWRFRTGSDGLELIADPNRVLPALDPTGREMLVSCGAALFGLRLAVRQAGYLPVVGLLPDPDQPSVLARVQLGAPAPMTNNERRLLAALPHRHTHRGAFEPGPVTASLLAGLRRDAAAEGATLCYVEQPDHYQQLAALVAAADRRQEADPAVRGETRGWTRPGGDAARDGVPAHAIPAPRYQQPGRLAQRDFDLGRDLGRDLGGTSGATSGCSAPAARLRPQPPSWSPPRTSRPTGCAPDRRCTGCCCTPPAAGCSPACTASRWRCHRCGPRSAPGWPSPALRR